MLDEMKKIRESNTSAQYAEAVRSIVNYLREENRNKEADDLEVIAALQGNVFSKREADDELIRKKEAVIKYCEKIQKNRLEAKTDHILLLLKNFPVFCRNLYLSKIHEKCSKGVREHLSGFTIENEYDLQKFMLAEMTALFPDARIESVQDSGHHAVRKDIVIDSESAVIELKCTRRGMSERSLSEEVASDMIHYDCGRLYFYIYDKANIISSPLSFRKTYEQKSVEGKHISMVIYSHSDI